MLAALLLVGTAHAAEGADGKRPAPAQSPLDTPGQAQTAAGAPLGPSTLAWDWERPRRILLESEVHLPQPMWFMAEHNKEQRAVAFQVRTVLDCAEAEAERKRVWRVTCKIDDIAITAAGLPQKEGLLDPIVKEFDERLTNTSLKLQIRHDGRISNVGIEGLERRRQRSGVINENLRLLLSRAIAGLDVQLPRDEIAKGSVWPQYHSWLMSSPSSVGTSGSAELLHKVEEVLPDGRYVLACLGDGLVVPGGGEDKYQTRLVAWAVFDPNEQFLTERAWNSQGLPTASSRAAEGMSGLPYNQLGRMRLLSPDEAVDLGESREVTPPGLTPTTLQMWPSLGATMH